jgi:hypothetical protein
VLIANTAVGAVGRVPVIQRRRRVPLGHRSARKASDRAVADSMTHATRRLGAAILAYRLFLSAYLRGLLLGTSRSSRGPLSRRRFRLIRSSGEADLSDNASISRAAIRIALATWLCRRRFLVADFFMSRANLVCRMRHFGSVEYWAEGLRQIECQSLLQIHAGTLGGGAAGQAPVGRGRCALGGRATGSAPLVRITRSCP